MGDFDARLFPANDRAGLEAGTRTGIRVAMRDGGYLYHSEHSVPLGTHLKTYRFSLGLILRYGRFG